MNTFGVRGTRPTSRKCARTSTQKSTAQSAPCATAAGVSTQHGRDILMIDWSKSGAGYGTRVWIQCKHTNEKTIRHKTVKDDIDDAAKLVKSKPEEYGDVRRFIVASSGSNDAALRLEIDEWNDAGNLPFHVELNCWDWFCARVRNDDGLWERYNGIRDCRLEPGLQIAADELASRLKEAVAQGDLAKAQSQVLRWKAEHADPDVGMPVLPTESWKHHYGLRDQLLTLHERAADTRRAVEILAYAYELPEHGGADRLLLYLRARRILQGLDAGRTPGSPATGPFGVSMMHLWGRISTSKGAPDALGSLALMTIMETDDVEVHEQVLEFMTDLCARNRGTSTETEAHIASALVRFHYVVRHGWIDAARHYALGDLVNGVDQIRMGDPRLGEPFQHEENDELTVLGINPLGCPSTWASEKAILVTQLCFWEGIDPDDLKELSRECVIYTVHIFPKSQVNLLESTVGVDTAERVADAKTLLHCVYDKEVHETANRYIVMVTEKAFERILGQRALLHAMCMRDGRRHGALLHYTKSLLFLCADGEPSTVRRKAVYVVPVYDNPPARPVVAQPDAAGPTRYTVSEQTLYELVRHKPANWGPDHPMYRDLVALYESRNDEFTMACLLALSRGVPMLGFDKIRQTLTTAMGIGSHQPYDRRTTPSDPILSR
jgi:hypothetical protein